MDAKVMAAVSWPKSVSYHVYIWAKWQSSAKIQKFIDTRVRIPLGKCLQKTGPKKKKKLDQDKAKTKGQKGSLRCIIIAIFCKIRLQLLFSLCLELKTLKKNKNKNTSSFFLRGVGNCVTPIFSDSFQLSENIAGFSDHDSIQGSVTSQHDKVMCVWVFYGCV